MCAGCDAGTYLVVETDPFDVINPVHGTCVPCGAGTYSTAVGATSAATCDAGGCQPRSLVPLANRSGCGPCAPGQRSVDGRACQPCLAGQYSPAGYGCQPCPPGAFARAGGASACDACAPGT